MKPTLTPPLYPFLISKSVINFCKPTQPEKNVINFCNPSIRPYLRNVAKLIRRRRISLKRVKHPSTLLSVRVMIVERMNV